MFWPLLAHSGVARFAPLPPPGQTGATVRPLREAAALGVERRKLADERARLAGEDTAPRRPEPPQTEQKHRGPKH